MKYKTKILPCPWCNETSELEVILNYIPEHSLNLSDEYVSLEISCDHCGYVHGIMSTSANNLDSDLIAAALKYWNSREGNTKTPINCEIEVKKRLDVLHILKNQTIQKMYGTSRFIQPKTRIQ